MDYPETTLMGSLILSIIRKLLLLISSFVSTSIFRLKRDCSFLHKNDEEIDFLEAEHELEEPECETGEEFDEFRDFVNDSEEDKEGVYLKFKFPTFEEFSKIHIGTCDSINSEVIPCESTSKVEIEKFNFSETEMNGLEKELEKIYEEKRGVHNGIEEKNEKNQLEFSEEVENRAESIRDEKEFEEKEDFIDESKQNSMSAESISGDGFLSSVDFDESVSELNDELSDEFDEEEIDLKEEEPKKSDSNLHDFEGFDSDFLSENDFADSSMADSDDSNKLESSWEHQELIEQLKMELRKVKATGLPTIEEESESTKIMDDLKPWKMDEKFNRQDFVGEIHKFYKSYREKMRKFDILNHQKMYTKGLLQLKSPVQSTTNPKPSTPTLKSLVSQNLWLSRHKINGSDPMKKLINELECDLELVYVAHMCLSWEFLHWQYEKALDLWDSDPRRIHRYNEVAGEFQQFQVLVQRFIEDEPFDDPSPRVQKYVKSRLVHRNILQIPLIREDNTKDKRKVVTKDMNEFVITSDMLVEIVEESIRIFWRFVKADKDCTIAAAISSHKNMELQNPQDIKLLLEVKRMLQKVERKVKYTLKSENCILRRFRQCREDDDSDQVLYFFLQVDMKLISRVLHMSKVTSDQLIWCHNKLSRISFVNRKMHVEPAFLLFPC